MSLTELRTRIVRRAHHLRHRPLDQLCWRVWFAFVHPAPDLRPPPPRRGLGASAWCAPAERTQGLLGPAQVCFLHVGREIASPGAWNDPSCERRWLYDLHNFHYLTARNWRSGLDWHAALIERWIAENPPAQGVGWEPYPLSLRVVNWIKWALAGNPLPDVAVHSLATQARFLRRRLERHIPGNHLLANGKALVFARLFFQGAEAEQWLQAGLRVFEQQLRRQILTDGGQCERSPMYHSIVLEDCLDLLNLTRAYDFEAAQPWLQVLPSMRRWLQVMRQPDGEITSFNDSALGIAPSVEELEAYALRLGLPPLRVPQDSLVHLADSGFVRLSRGPAVAWLDIGLIGPDYLAGHGHADTCTFEMSLFGRRLVVDSGISRYDRSAERLRQRGTAAHNTVVIDGQNSSDIWDDFKVGRRARVFDVEVRDGTEVSQVSAAHDGYCRLRGVGRHRRQWVMSDRELIITDTIDGSSQRQVAVVFHFHPRIVVRCMDPTQYELLEDGGRRVATLQVDARLQSSVQGSTYHPELGLSLANQRVVGEWSGRLPLRVVNTFRWA